MSKSHLEGANPPGPLLADSFESLRSALAGRYIIERELGRGGNAVVYLARDRKHDRRVALKVVQPELALAVRAERFLREIQIAAKLTHPHILPLHDSGEAAGALYYVMPYVEGESLRQRLEREKQLPLEEALRITREVAAALSYAHEQGVVHRDIKPENILLARGEAVVADFGIARALTVAGGESVTETGVAVGTPAYMSPEQAGGGKVDGRSDVYSLGCVLYEMLAGHPPFTGATAQEILSRHALDPVPSLRAARPDVPPAIEQAIVTVLAKAPVARFPSATGLVAALSASGTGAQQHRRRPMYAALGLGVVLVGVAAGWQALRSTRPAAAAEQSVAVLPFTNLSTTDEDQYFSDGITEELINALTQVPGLRVPARTSSFAFKGKSTDIRGIGRQLGVAHVLEGTMRRAGTMVRVSAQLSKVTDGFNLWSHTFEVEVRPRDLFAVQDEIARAVVSALLVRLSPSDSTMTRSPPTSSTEAYDLYSRGRFHWKGRAREDLFKAIDYFEKAIALDSGLAEASSALADVYVIGHIGNQVIMQAKEAWPKADSAARRAIQLDPNLAEAHTSLGKVLEEYRRDFSAAEAEYRRAIALNPQYPLAHAWYGHLLAVRMRRFDEAVREGLEALRLDPLSPSVNHELGTVMLAAGRYDEAVQYLESTIDLDPDWSQPWWRLADAYLAKGMIPQALDAYQRLVATARLPTARDSAGLAHLYARTGNRAEARKILDRLKQASRTQDVWQPLAIVYAGLDDPDHAFEALERARASGQGFTQIGNNRLFDPLRSDPRFAAFVRRAGWEP